MKTGVHIFADPSSIARIRRVSHVQNIFLNFTTKTLSMKMALWNPGISSNQSSPTGLIASQKRNPFCCSLFFTDRKTNLCENQIVPDRTGHCARAADKHSFVCTVASSKGQALIPPVTSADRHFDHFGAAAPAAAAVVRRQQARQMFIILF